MTPWLHVLGAGQWQVPTIRLARRLGYKVFVSDIYEERPGYADADAYEIIDIRDAEKTLEASVRRKISGILCDTTDVGVTTAAYIAERLHLPGIGLEAAKNFTRKDRMRELTTAAGLPGPRFEIVHTLFEAQQAAERIGFPVIVKPTDNQSSRGVSCVTTSKALADAVAYAYRSTTRDIILIEEFIVGTEITVETFCWKGEVFTLGISDKEHFSENPQVASQLVYPADFSPEQLAQVKEVNQFVIRTLGLDTGVTHAEYMVNKNGIFLVEIAARGGGSRIYSDIIPYLSGLPIPEMMIRWSLGEAIQFKDLRSEPASAILAFFSAPSGKVQAITGMDESLCVPGVHEILIEVQPGECFGGIRDDRSRPGFLVGFGHTRADVLATAANVRSKLRITMESEPTRAEGGA